MPILRLNSAKINYHYSIGEDNFIISEIVNSNCSYEVPIIIRDKQTLDIYFGQNYSGRGYHNELLSRGVSLFLYRPVSSEKRELTSDYTFSDLDKWEKEIFLCYSEFPDPSKVQEKKIYVDGYNQEEYIWISDLNDYINIKILPQNLYSEENFESWYNRDTLRLCSSRVFSLDEKYKDGAGDDFYLINSEDEVYDRKGPEKEESSLKTSYEFYNYTKDHIKIYSSDKLEDFFILISGGNRVPQTTFTHDLFPEKSYHISVLLDDNKLLENLLWLEGKSLLTLINSKLPNYKKIDSCGRIKVIRIFKEVRSKFTNSIIACHPRYKTDYPIKYNKGISLVQHFSENPEYYEDFINGNRDLSFSIKFPEITEDNIENLLFYSKKINGESVKFSKFLGLPLPGDSKKVFLICFKDSRIQTSLEIGLDLVNLSNYKEINIFDETRRKIRTWDEIFQEIENIIIEKNYCCKRLEKFENRGLLIYSYLGTIPNVGFSNIPDLEIIPDQSVTQDILSYETESLKRIEFYSKTIGPNDENIKIKIEPINYYSDRYRITISRFSYSEVFDLNLYDTPDKDGRIESMDDIITRRSNLVRCKLFREKPDGTLWKEGDSDGKLPIGEWELKRSTSESEIIPEMYWTALNHMSEETNIKEDFFCIPEIERFIRNDGKYDYNLIGYFKEYEEILEYCKHKNCQALIGNLDFPISDIYPGINEDPTNRTIYRTKIGENSDKTPIYSYEVYWNKKYQKLDLKPTSLILQGKNTFIYNYNQDYDNYLIYFYRDMSLWGKYSRPAYYLFLNGILTGRYSASTGEILYNSPVKNSYVDENIEEDFQRKKTNYLVSNNQTYFYKSYQNHPGDGNYNSLILTKFALSKISRVIENNKRSLLGKQSIGDIKKVVNRLLLKLVSTYSIYYDIILSNVLINHKENSIIIKISVYIRELINEPISLDLELNYIY